VARQFRQDHRRRVAGRRHSAGAGGPDTAAIWRSSAKLSQTAVSTAPKVERESHIPQGLFSIQVLIIGVGDFVRTKKRICRRAPL
jgi:hypothetical protein